MLITELFDKKVEYKVIDEEPNHFATEATIGDRVIEVGIDTDGDDEWSVAFGERVPGRKRLAFNVTGGGSELEVFSMVRDSILEFIKKYNPTKISFSADKKEGNKNRADVYSKLLKRFSVPGYSVKRSDGIHDDYFTLEKKNAS